MMGLPFLLIPTKPGALKQKHTHGSRVNAWREAKPQARRPVFGLQVFVLGVAVRIREMDAAGPVQTASRAHAASGVSGGV